MKPSATIVAPLVLAALAGAQTPVREAERDAANQEIFVVALVNLGDNSVQVIDLSRPVPGVRAVELVLSGSGAIGRLRWCPQGAHGEAGHGHE